MAADDESLIAEARVLTDYDSDIINDEDMQDLVDLGKEEISGKVGNQSLTFYNEETFQATRALFWYVCIAAKVKAGELAGMNISADDFEASNPAESHYGFWFDNFQEKLSRAQRSLLPGASVISIERSSERVYGDE